MLATHDNHLIRDHLYEVLQKNMFIFLRNLKNDELSKIFMKS